MASNDVLVIPNYPKLGNLVQRLEGGKRHKHKGICIKPTFPHKERKIGKKMLATIVVTNYWIFKIM